MLSQSLLILSASGMEREAEMTCVNPAPSSAFSALNSKLVILLEL